MVLSLIISSYSIYNEWVLSPGYNWLTCILLLLILTIALKISNESTESKTLYVNSAVLEKP